MERKAFVDESQLKASDGLSSSRALEAVSGGKAIRAGAEVVMGTRGARGQVTETGMGMRRSSLTWNGRPGQRWNTEDTEPKRTTWVGQCEAALRRQHGL